MRTFLYLAVWIAATMAATVQGGDWPMWGKDAARSAVSEETLPATLHLQWTRELGKPTPAWPGGQKKLQFDAAYEPVVKGGNLFVSSMVADKVTAYDTKSGAELWRFYAQGPVRFAPVAHSDKVTFISDDGYIYCVGALDGKLVWKFRGGPEERFLLGNRRLVSMWPARGGPVYDDGVIYFAASIWPFMGTFVYALDAETGSVIWSNSGSGSSYQTQQHNSPAFSGVAPQGYFALKDDTLLVSGGRSVPAAYDRKTGNFRYFHISSRQFGKDAGGYAVNIAGDVFFTGKAAYDLKTGDGLLKMDRGIATASLHYSMDGDELVAHKLPPEVKEETGRRGKKQKKVQVQKLWDAELSPDPDRLFLKSGGRLYGSKGEDLIVVNLDRDGSEVIQEEKVGDEPLSMIAADGRLFVTTENGTLLCYGGDEVEPKRLGVKFHSIPVSDEKVVQHVSQILTQSRATNGYCLVWGVGRPGLVDELIRQSSMHVVVVTPEADVVQALRRKYDRRELYGRRVAVINGDPLNFPFPAYMANLIVADDFDGLGKVSASDYARLFHPLRPYGGTAVLSEASASWKDLSRWATSHSDFAADRDGSSVYLSRPGRLAGAGSWTHQNGNASNTRISPDQLAKAPLGLLWFGGVANDGVLPRHGHGPTPQIVGGRLFIEGADMLRAVDVYTGQLIWQRSLPGIGKFYDNTSHQPGANEIGGNYVSVEDGVYVMAPTYCWKLDPATGETVTEFELPTSETVPNPKWGSVAVWEDLLLATTSPIAVSSGGKDNKEDEVKPEERLRPLLTDRHEWQYLAGRHPEGDWTSIGFEDSGWKTGTAGFGYGDNDDETELKDMRNKYRVVYLRQVFDVQDLEAVTELLLGMRYDDGFVAYLNGKEVLRQGVSSGSGASAGSVESHDAEGYEYFPIPESASLLKEGENVLAIEGHNTSITSSDFSLEPWLGVPAQSHDLVPMLKEPKKWSYLAGEHPTSDWMKLEFNGSDWKVGQAGFGYGDKDDATELKDMKDAYQVVYLRQEFDVADVSKLSSLHLGINYDDAFIAYLNGKELLRVGVGKGAGENARDITSHEAGDEESFELKDAKALLKAGRNVLAIEGHNERRGSSDFTLDPWIGLQGAQKPKPEEKEKANESLLTAKVPGLKANTDYAARSSTLLVMDRQNNDVLWSRSAKYSFRHNTVIAGGGKVYCIDSLTEKKRSYLNRRGWKNTSKPSILALDARSGRVVWDSDDQVFGTWLAYSAKHDILVEAGSNSRDRAKDEVGAGLAAYQAKDGKLLWRIKDKYSGPVMLHHETIITQTSAYDLKTGERRMRLDPFTGTEIPWSYGRNYGCNTSVGSEHLLTFRSAAAGYFDLTNDGGTGNLGGFRSGCTSSLIAADGILNSPDYTRTCSCSYQNQTSLALVHMPDVEVWTFNKLDKGDGPLKRLNVNFGAPGDRRDSDGAMWFEYPVVGGPSPSLGIKVEFQKGSEKGGQQANGTFRHHPSRVTEGTLPWVTSSGLEGVTQVIVPVGKKSRKPRPYTVRLLFAELSTAVGSRVFDVYVQGELIEQAVDVAKRAGGVGRSLVIESTGVAATETVNVKLVPEEGSEGGAILSGLELLAE